MRAARPVGLIRSLLVLIVLVLAAPAAAQSPTPTITPDPCPSAHCLNCGGICNCADAKWPACIGICGMGAGMCVPMAGVCGCAVTPTATPTTTRTPTPTPTPEPLDHFTCYKAKTTKGGPAFSPIPNPPGVALVDAFSTATAEVRKTVALCAPTNKLGEDPTAPLHPEHLKAYQMKRATPQFPFFPTVVDQFNPSGLHLQAQKPAQLLVPSAKSLGAPPPLPPSFETDHFACYKVKVQKGAPKFVPVAGVTLEDQFGSLVVTVKKPTVICNPADKNGEDPGAPSHLARLMCYKVKRTGSATFAKRTGVHTRDQFGPERLDLTTLSELCVPAVFAP